jgi:rhomboid protease GluP
MFRKTSGSVVCPSCGSLVGVNDAKCYTCGRANPGLWGFAPLLRQLGNDMGFGSLVVGVCGLWYVLGLLTTPGGLAGGGLNFLSPAASPITAFAASGQEPVFIYGFWWTLLTASWVHGGLLHIIFNMMAVRNLMPSTVDLIGPGRTITIYILAGAAGFLLTSVVRMYFPFIPFLSGASSTVGASASICGLLGAISQYGRKSGSSLIRAQTSQWAISLVVMGVLFRGVDNVAHLGGFLGGYALTAYFNPLTKERGDHMLMALGCLAATALALAYTVYQSFDYIVALRSL